jgi:hypothetical protein
MPINIENETIVSLTEATKTLPRVNGKRPAISTLWRWCRKGLRGVRLEYIRVGRNIATSREALNRFFEALAQDDTPPVQTPPPVARPERQPAPAARHRALDDADRILKEARI